MRYKKVLCMALAAIMAAGGLGTLDTVRTEAAVEEFEFDADTKTIVKYNGKQSEVEIPSTIDGVKVTTIGEDAFSSNEYIEVVTIPKSVTSIENEAFLNCPNLESVEMSDNVKKLGRLSFFMCESLEDISLSDSITEIKENTFYGCSELDEIKLPDKLTTIGSHAFEECADLESVKLSSGVTTIDNEAFKNCKSLKEVQIPDTVKNLGEGVFSESKKVKIVCSSNSVAYQYAKNNGVSVEVTNKPTIPAKTSYDITYILNGGAFEEEVTETYDGSYSLRLPKPQRKGYTFEGWYSNSNLTKKVTVLKKGSTGDKRFYAKWSKISLGRVKISSVQNSASKAMTVKIKKVSKADGYQLAYATKLSMKNKKLVSFTGSSKTVKKLSKGKRYYVVVRAYKYDSTNKKVYGKYTLIPKSVKIKK